MALVLICHYVANLFIWCFVLKKVLIIGPPRSGTTALQGVVCASLGAEFMPECNYLTDIFSLYDRVTTYPDPVRFNYFFKDEGSAARLYSSLVEKVLTVMGSGGDRPLVLKDPLLSACFPRAADLLDAKTVCLAIVRHPADVMASMKRVRKKAGADWDMESDIMTVYRCYDGIRSISQNECTLSKLVVRYEDLILGQSLDAVSDFLGNSIDLAKSSSPEWLARTGAFKSQGYGRAFSSDSSGEGTISLTPAELNRVQSIFAGIMAHWEYQAKA
nr:sulfotransferase [Rhizobium sp. E27B/91]